MSTARPPQGASPNSTPANPAAPPVDDGQPPLPPDEKFWQRHSPHHEFPLSLVATVLFHLLVLFGAVILVSVMFSGCGKTLSDPLPIDSLEVDDGGSGGTPQGDDASTTKQEVAVQQRQPDLPPTPVTPDIQKPVVQPNPDEAVIDPNAPKREDQPATNQAQSLDDALEQAIASTGPRGTGEGAGGSGGNTKGHANDRTRRIKRWTMQLNYGDANEYLRQLYYLHAQVGFPVPGDNKSVFVVRDLTVRPAQLEKVSVGSINRIFWRDTNERSVLGVYQVLQLPRPPTGQKLIFYAFMPRELEEDLVKKELEVGKKARPPLTKESEIGLTVFGIEFFGQRPVISVVQQQGVGAQPAAPANPRRGR
jgi:hypothetical protein